MYWCRISDRRRGYVTYVHIFVFLGRLPGWILKMMFTEILMEKCPWGVFASLEFSTKTRDYSTYKAVWLPFRMKVTNHMGFCNQKHPETAAKPWFNDGKVEWTWWLEHSALGFLGWVIFLWRFTTITRRTYCWWKKHQLIWRISFHFSRVLYFPGGAGCLRSTIPYRKVHLRFWKKNSVIVP